MKKIMKKRKTWQRINPKYDNLRGKDAVENFVLDLFFVVIYADTPKGRKPLKKVRNLLEKGRMGGIGKLEDLRNLETELLSIIRRQKTVDDLKEFITEYVYKL
jgi:hypothetical protein